MKAFFKILILSLIPVLSFSQKNADGVYLEVEDENCLYNQLRLKNTEEFICILDNPLITVNDFKAVSPLEENIQKNTREFSILMNKDGKRKLSSISKLYRGKHLAFVVDNEVICLMLVKGEIINGKFKVLEDLNYSSLKQVHKKMQKRIEQ